MQLFLRILIATLALTHLAPTGAMSRTFMRRDERPCIEPLVSYLEKEGTLPLPKSDLATAYLRCYYSRSKSQKEKEIISHCNAYSYELPCAPTKQASRAALRMLHCEKKPNNPAKCVLEATDKNGSCLLEPTNPALFDLLAMAHGLQIQAGNGKIAQ